MKQKVELDMQDVDAANPSSSNEGDPTMEDENLQDDLFDSLSERSDPFSDISTDPPSMEEHEDVLPPMGTPDNFPSIEQELQGWAISHKIPHSALKNLLKILNPHFPVLPKDPRTLLKTPQNSNITEKSGGDYFHFGLQDSLMTNIQKYCP